MVEPILIPASECIVCGAPAFGNWFCKCCHEVKEAAYAESRRLGELTHQEVLTRRDAALAKHKAECHPKRDDT